MISLLYMHLFLRYVSHSNKPRLQSQTDLRSRMGSGLYTAITGGVQFEWKIIEENNKRMISNSKN